MPRQRVEVGEERCCKNCDRVLGAIRHGEFCNTDCELQYLRQQVREKDERLQRLARKKGPIQCLGRVHWRTCVQEWYLKDSYDAKRRANQLRKLGYFVQATSIGRMPIETEDDIETTRVTILTAWREEDPNGPLPPPPAQFIDGLRTTNGGR